MMISPKEWEDDLRAALEDVLGKLDEAIAVWPDNSSDGVDDVLKSLVEPQLEVIVVGPHTPVDTAIDIASIVEERHPGVVTVLVMERTTALLERALRAGVAGVLDPACPAAEVRAVLTDARARSQRRREQLGWDSDTGPHNHVIPILAAKGGAGKTTISTNLAVALSQIAPGEVVIVDADLQFGDVTSGLGIDPPETISSTLRFGESLDATTLKAFLTPVGSGNLFVLPAPISPAHADDLTAAHFGRVLRLLHQEFRFVVIDTSAGIDEMTLEALDIATDLIVLTSMDVPSVRAAAKELDAIRLLGLDHLPTRLVLNRANAKVGLSPEDVEASLGRAIDFQIPSSRSVPVSVNQGEPVVEYDPRLPASKAIISLAQSVAGVDTNKGAARRRWRSGS